jgi:hypothetical protein
LALRAAARNAVLRTDTAAQDVDRERMTTRRLALAKEVI